MNVNFCGAPTKNIKNDMQTLIKQCEKASISVAYLKNSGVELLKESLDENKDSNAKISIITSLDFGITDVEGLRESLNMGLRCSIMHAKNFHPKLYIFEMGEGNAAMIVGSSNLSNGGLSTNYEANLVISGKVSNSPIKEAIEYFSLIESESVPLDEKIIDLYGERKSTIDDIKNRIGDDEANLDELNEYLNSKTSSENLTEDEIDDLFAEADNNHDEADAFFEKGMIHESIELYKKAYNIYNIVDAHDSNIISDGKINCLVGMARSSCKLYQFEYAQRYTNEAEKLAQKLAEIIDDSNHLLNVLVCSVSSQTELDAENKKCNQFIERYESKQNKYDNDSGIGRVYLASANCKFKLNNKGEAIKNLYSAIFHLENALQNSNDDWNLMIDHLNLAAVYEAKRIIARKDDFDGIKITNHYEDALKLADMLKLRFWEGSIRINMGECFFYTEKETFSQLKIARRIFSELGYDEIIRTVDEMTKKWEEYYKNN